MLKMDRETPKIRKNNTDKWIRILSWLFQVIQRERNELAEIEKSKHGGNKLADRIGSENF